jgi:hypothetical protein
MNLRLTLLFLALIITAFSASSQSCYNSGPTICTPAGNFPLPGLFPQSDSLPCAEAGIPYNQTIQFKNFTTVQGFNVSWLRVDSIGNLPCGLCWSTNKTTNQFNGGELGCLNISGTTNDAPGQYKIKIIVTVNVGFATLSNVDAESQGLKYYVRVTLPGVTCTPLDTNAAGLTAHGAPGVITAPTINAGGPTTFCQGGSVALTATAGYYAYLWSNGQTGQTINVSQSGTYNVTAYDVCNSAASLTPVTVTVNSASTTITASGPLAFCSGGSVTLDAGAGFSSYLWSDNSTSQTLTTSSAGTYSVTVTDANSCTASAGPVTTSIASTLTPTITADGSLNICPGGDVQLDAGAGYDTYNWSNGDNTQTINANASGNYTVTVTQGACNGSSQAVSVTVGNFPVSVNISPAGPIVGCVGDSVVLDAGPAYDVYNWSNGEFSSAVTITTSGTYTLTVQDDGCVGRDTVEVTLNAIPAPNIIPVGAQSICSNESITLNAGAGFDSYAWSNGGNTQQITVNTAGTFTVTVTDNGCSGVANNPVVLTVNAAPVASIGVSTSIPTNTFQAQPVGQASYVWQFASDTINGPFTTEATTSTDTVRVNWCEYNGKFARVIVTNADGCIDTSSNILVPFCEGINDINIISNLLLMPNPSHNTINISYTLDERAETRMYISDLSGRVVKEIYSGDLAAGNKSLPVDIQELTEGVYSFNISTASGKLSKLFIKQ